MEACPLSVRNTFLHYPLQRSTPPRSNSLPPECRLCRDDVKCTCGKLAEKGLCRHQEKCNYAKCKFCHCSQGGSQRKPRRSRHQRLSVQDHLLCHIEKLTFDMLAKLVGIVAAAGEDVSHGNLDYLTMGLDLLKDCNADTAAVLYCALKDRCGEGTEQVIQGLKEVIRTGGQAELCNKLLYLLEQAASAEGPDVGQQQEAGKKCKLPNMWGSQSWRWPPSNQAGELPSRSPWCKVLHEILWSATRIQMRHWGAEDPGAWPLCGPLLKYLSALEPQASPPTSPCSTEPSPLAASSSPSLSPSSTGGEPSPQGWQGQWGLHQPTAEKQCDSGQN